MLKKDGNLSRIIPTNYEQSPNVKSRFPMSRIRTLFFRATSSINLSLFHYSKIAVDHHVSTVTKVCLLLPVEKEVL